MKTNNTQQYYGHFIRKYKNKWYITSCCHAFKSFKLAMKWAKESPTDTYTYGLIEADKQIQEMFEADLLCSDINI